ncbi:Hypothetical protein D9617_16g013870 [Elsinoe fawcettii]|nr:Hypothetical protein D9617_16g013870 [Elsinoe fawcettii]
MTTTTATTNVNDEDSLFIPLGSSSSRKTTNAFFLCHQVTALTTQEAIVNKPNTLPNKSHISCATINAAHPNIHTLKCAHRIRALALTHTGCGNTCLNAHLTHPIRPAYHYECTQCHRKNAIFMRRKAKGGLHSVPAPKRDRGEIYKVVERKTVRKATMPRIEGVVDLGRSILGPRRR